MSATFWNEEMETLSPADLLRYEEPLLTDQIRYLYDTSHYYRHKLDTAGVKPASITCQESLESIPFTEKKDLAQTQLDGDLVGPHLCAPQDKIVRLVGTGGTSGRPMRIAWTRNDVDAYNEMGARALWIMGCRPGDLVINCFNYSIYAGGVMDHMAFEALGAMVLAYGVGKSRELLAMLADLPGEKCLYSTPSYAVKLAELAADEGVELGNLRVRKGFFSGEAGLQVPGYRHRIEETWGLSAHDLYGIAELGCQSAECDHRVGMHYCGGGLVVAELIDPETGTVKKMRPGETGEIVYTALKREASPMLRLRSHDIVEVQPGICACGRTRFRFQTHGRSDDMFVVKGVNIYPMSIQKVLSGVGPQITGEFQVILDRPPPFDYSPRIHVEASRGVPKHQYDSLKAKLVELIGRKVGFAATIELVAQGNIASEHKTKRVLRPYLEPGKSHES